MSNASVLEFDVVVLGGGFGGVYCAQTLERALGRHATTKTALISEENYMVFQPMLAEVVGGSLSPRHVINPLRLLCPRTEILKGSVESIDWPGRSLVLLAGPLAGRVTVRFRHLVLALGAVIDLSRYPGMPEHAFLMQNVGDAMLLRSTIISRLEEANIERRPEVRARLLTFVVVGGGYSGVETAGQIIDLFRDIDKFYPHVEFKDLRVILIHSRERLLPTIEARLGDYCGRVMRERGLDLRLNARVRAVTATQVRLEDGTDIPAATVISTVGNAPNPLILDLIKNNALPGEKGRIVTDPMLRVPGHDGLWAIGDCAAVPFANGGYSPQTAQFAYRQGKYAGRNIVAQIRNRPLRPFLFKGLGELASIGHHTAVAQIGSFNFSGFIAWFMWRTIYLQKLPRLDRKLRVMIDWTLDLFFARDINQLSPRYSKLLKEIHLESGEVLFNAGEPAFSLYAVRSGKIELSDERGPVSCHTTGDYFGERALLGDGRWRFTARAVEPSQLVSIPGGMFRQIVGVGGSLGRLFEKSANRYQSREVVDAIVRRLPSAVMEGTVRELMQTDLVTLRSDQSVASVVSVLREHPHSSYPVVDSAGVYLGVIGREDFHDFLRRGPDLQKSVLADIGLSFLPTMPPNAPVHEMVERLVRSGANKVMVVDDARHLQGIVTVMDLASAAHAEKPATARAPVGVK